MEDFFRKFGVPSMMWIVSLFSATLFTLYRIYETDVAPSKRKIISMLIMGLVSALLVPGLVVHWLKIENPSVAGVVTGGVVYSFEQIITALRAIILKKITDKSDGNIS